MNETDPKALPDLDQIALPEGDSVAPLFNRGDTVIVERSGGQIEENWMVVAKRVFHDETGSNEYVKVAREGAVLPDGNPGIFTKWVRTDTLLSWQPSTKRADGYEGEVVGSVANDSESKGSAGTDRDSNPGTVEEVSNAALFIPESDWSPRYLRLFAPQVVPHIGNDPAPQFNYDILFETDDKKIASYREHYSKQQTQWEARQSQQPRVTEESTMSARSKITLASSCDRNIKAIIEHHGQINGISDPENLVELVRTNPNLRYDLGSYFMGKLLENIDRMPDRVASNGQKRPNHRGYERFGYLSSGDYSVLLAMSMLDGTFHEPTHDPIKLGSDGRAELGQHRSAAELLLDYIP